MDSFLDGLVSKVHRVGDEIASHLLQHPGDPARDPGNAPRPTAAATAMRLRVQHTTDVRLRRPHHRGLHGAAPEAPGQRRAAVPLLHGRDRSRAPSSTATPTATATTSATSTCSRPTPVSWSWPGARSRPLRPWRTSRPTSPPCSSTISWPPRPARPSPTRSVPSPRACHVAGDPEATMKQRRGGRPRAAPLRARGDRRRHRRGGGAGPRPRRVPGLRPPGSGRLSPGRAARALRQRLRLRAWPRLGRGLARLGRRLRRGARAGSRSTPPTTPPRPRATCGWRWAATTPTCPRPAASTRATPAKSSR